MLCARAGDGEDYLCFAKDEEQQGKGLLERGRRESSATEYDPRIQPAETIEIQEHHEFQMQICFQEICFRNADFSRRAQILKDQVPSYSATLTR